ncbi:MAG: ankyrin repeat domain-containing protein [Alphaproteobacteria bacterium]
MKFLQLVLLTFTLGSGGLFGMELTKDVIDSFCADHMRSTKYKTWPKEMFLEAVDSLRGARDLSEKKAIISSFTDENFTSAYNNYLERNGLPYPEIPLTSPLTYLDPENIQLDEKAGELRYLNFHADKVDLARARGFLSAFFLGADDIAFFDETEKTQLFIALCFSSQFRKSSEKSVALAKLVIDSMGDINKTFTFDSTNTTQLTVLSFASSGGDLAILNHILLRKPNLYWPARGFSPLHCSVASGYENAFDVLLPRYHSVNTQDFLGQTPALLAVIYKTEHFYQGTALEKLVSRGADLNIPDHDGNLPLGIALEKKMNYQVIELLIEGGASTEEWAENPWLVKYLNETGKKPAATTAEANDAAVA